MTLSTKKNVQPACQPIPERNLQDLSGLWARARRARQLRRVSNVTVGLISQVEGVGPLAAYNRIVSDLETLVGEQLIFGLAGPKLTDTDIKLFRETRAGGLILYRRNFESPAQHTKLLEDLEAALERRLLVATDHEGGRIVMLG